MAIYHLTTKHISRKTGRTATAAAAYRSATMIYDERTGETHDYRNKRGVEYTECVIVSPDGQPTFLDREQLWNAAELAEKRKDARTAREFIVALPHELDAIGRQHTARVLGSTLSKKFGVAVDICVHEPDKDGDQRNHHAHIMVTTRKVKIENGRAILGEKSDLELSDRELRKRYGSDASGRNFINMIRKGWETIVNGALESKGIDARIDHRSHVDRGLQELPTIKLGVAASAMERKGIQTDRGDINRAIKAANAQHREIQKEIEQAQQAQQHEYDRTAQYIDATDRAIESTDQRIDDIKRSIEQRKRSAATTHSEVATGQQRTTTAADSETGTNIEFTEADRAAARVRSAADRSIDEAEQCINTTKQLIDTTTKDIALYDREASRADEYIQQLDAIHQRQVQSVAPAPEPQAEAEPPAPEITPEPQAEAEAEPIPPSPPKPKPVPVKLPVTHWRDDFGMKVFIGTYAGLMGKIPNTKCYHNEIEFDLETQTIISHTQNDVSRWNEDIFVDRATVHAIALLGFKGKIARDGYEIKAMGLFGYNDMMNKTVGTPLRYDQKYLSEIRRGMAYADTGEIIPPKEPTTAAKDKPAASRPTPSKDRDDDLDFGL